MWGGHDIRNFTIKVADENYLEFEQGLRNIGVSRNVARLITYLCKVDEASSKDIEIATKLRQSEVSIATQTLRKRSWLVERELKKDGKGRPRRMYALQPTIEEIIKYYEAEKAQELNQKIKAIERLKDLSSA